MPPPAYRSLSVLVETADHLARVRRMLEQRGLSVVPEGFLPNVERERGITISLVLDAALSALERELES